MTLANGPADEFALLSPARAGDLDGFGEICRLYEGRLLRQAITLGCDSSGAEDLVQETLVEAWKSLRRYNGSCRFYTWLCAILLNRYRNAFRRKRLLWFSRRQPEEYRSEADLERFTSLEPMPDEEAERHERARLLRECIAALPPKQQQVIHLRFFADDSLEGIAAALGCSVGTVKSRLFHALDRLRRMKALQSPDYCGMSQPGAQRMSATSFVLL
jgi:RNA polymerase sigma-70 factor (ECF subfamily)